MRITLNLREFEKGDLEQSVFCCNFIYVENVKLVFYLEKHQALQQNHNFYPLDKSHFFGTLNNENVS